MENVGLHEKGNAHDNKILNRLFRSSKRSAFFNPYSKAFGDCKIKSSLREYFEDDLPILRKRFFNAVEEYRQQVFAEGGAGDFSSRMGVNLLKPTPYNPFMTY